MRCALLFILGLCCLASTIRPGFAEKPLRLCFEKNIAAPASSPDQHVVQKGEWLCKILNAKGYSTADISQLIPLIQAMNPHIPDINHLRPSQVLRLPEPDRAMRAAAVVRNEDYAVTPYTIRPGDTLARIMQEHGVPAKQVFGQFMSLFLTLNPGVPDTNTLHTGQEVILPVPKSYVQNQPEQRPHPEFIPDQPAAPATLLPYPGGTASLSTSLPHDLAPHMDGAVFGQTGSNASLPGSVPDTLTPNDAAPSPLQPPSMAAIQSFASHGTVAVNATSADRKPERPPKTGLPLVRSVLEQMGFSFVLGDESMLPLSNAEWLHVKMQETPLLTTPWGARLLLCPVPKTAEWIKNANSLDIKVCTVGTGWTLQDVLEKLAQAFPQKLLLWNPERELVLAEGDISLTLKAPHILIQRQESAKKVFLVWPRGTSAASPLPQGLPEILETAHVRLIELDASNELFRLPSLPRSSVYVPEATPQELLAALPDVHVDTAPDSLSVLLQMLKDKSLLRQGRVQAAWSTGQGRIAVQVPAWTIDSGKNKIALLSRRLADAALVSVLADAGYMCFILPD